MASRSLRFKAGISAIALLVAVFGAYGFRKLQALAADPTAEKDCRAERRAGKTRPRADQGGAADRPP